MDCPYCERPRASEQEHAEHANCDGEHCRDDLCWRRGADDANCQFPTPEEWAERVARRTAERDEQAALAARALERERRTHEEAAALREALAALHMTNGAIADCEELTCRTNTRVGDYCDYCGIIHRALATDAGRGYLPPTDSPGAVAVAVADGWALAGTTVYAMPDVTHPYRGQLDCGRLWVTRTQTGLHYGVGQGAYGPENIYRDRARCIQDAVRALTPKRQAQVMCIAVGGDVFMEFAPETIDKADPDALLRAYQEVTRG